jgi:pre-mRNA-splicing factor 18
VRAGLPTDVLNDEKTRKWIQSMKRLMTFCQNKYLPDDLAKTAGWVKA